MADWQPTDGPPVVRPNQWIEAKGRFGDIYGPLPAEMFASDAWGGNMLHASHDLYEWRLVNRG